MSRWIENLSRIYRVDKEHRNLSRWIEVAVENVLSRNPEISMDQRSYRDSIEKKPRNLNGSKKLSRFYREKTQKSRWIEKLSRCYREGKEHRKIPRWIENLSKIYRERTKKSSIERRFFKKGKTQRDECNKQAINQTSKQHIKLSKLNST